MDIDKTSIIQDSKLGNSLTAALDISPGEVIISISEPFLIVVEKDTLNQVCSYCFAPSEAASLRRCAGCKVTRYCSAACQKADWGSIHSKECSILKKLPGVPPTAVRGMIQILLRHAYGKNLDPKWAGLESHINELRKSKRWEEIMLQARAAVKYSKGTSALMEMALNLLCRVSYLPRLIQLYTKVEVDVNKCFPSYSFRWHPSWALLLAKASFSKSFLQSQRVGHL